MRRGSTRTSAATAAAAGGRLTPRTPLSSVVHQQTDGNKKKGVGRGPIESTAATVAGGARSQSQPQQQQQPSINGSLVVADLVWLQREAGRRCMVDAVKWAAEVLLHCPDAWFSTTDEQQRTDAQEPLKMDAAARAANLAAPLMQTGEFLRAAHWFTKAHSLLEATSAQNKERRSLLSFLMHWATYLHITKTQLERETASLERKAAENGEAGVEEQRDLISLQQRLERLRASNSPDFDVFHLYLLGRLQSAQGDLDTARQTLMAVVKQEPRLVPGWDELVRLVGTPNQLALCAALGRQCWQSEWFAAAAMLRLHDYLAAADKVEQLMSHGFGDAQPELLTMAARARNAMHEHDEACALFERMLQADPNRIEHLHLYSDSLFVNKRRVELADLAHRLHESHRFNFDTCCVVANHHSYRGDHAQAVRALHLATRLQPQSPAVWTLIGHEFMELQNNAAACLAYRRAIEADAADFRGWYGLGQLYDILKMQTYALYYYQQAHKCRPSDSRMLVAMGSVYAHMGRRAEAKKCFLNAFNVGDVENSALMRLARLYEEDRELELAAAAYERYLRHYHGEQSDWEDENVPTCLGFLARHYLATGARELASAYAQKCYEFDQTREVSRAVLRQLEADWQGDEAAGTSRPPTRTLKTPVPEKQQEDEDEDDDAMRVDQDDVEPSFAESDDEEEDGDDDDDEF